MFRLFTFFVSIVGFAALVWFGVTVELGDRTLFGHLRAIGGTQEAQKLWDGTKDKVTDLVGIEAARRAEAAKAAFKDPPAPGPATERAPSTAPAKPAEAAPAKPLAAGKPTAKPAAAPPAGKASPGKSTPTGSAGKRASNQPPAQVQGRRGESGAARPN